jgi:hypothetical protein
MQQPQPQQRHSTTRRKEEVLFSVIRSAISTTSTSAQTICTINNLQNKYCAQFKYWILCTINKIVCAIATCNLVMWIDFGKKYRFYLAAG